VARAALAVRPNTVVAVGPSEEIPPRRKKLMDGKPAVTCASVSCAGSCDRPSDVAVT
jgi:hypothetical protein